MLWFVGTYNTWLVHGCSLQALCVTPALCMYHRKRDWPQFFLASNTILSPLSNKSARKWHCAAALLSLSQFSQEPLVPIGCLVTAYFLGSGIKSFYNRDAARSQKMMRLRVAAQFSTLLIFVGYAGMNAFTLNPRPKQYGEDGEEK